jgi:hypothetical protein
VWLRRWGRYDVVNLSFINNPQMRFSENTHFTTTKRDVHSAGLARYREGVVGGWRMHVGEWSALPCGSAFEDAYAPFLVVFESRRSRFRSAHLTER